MSPARQQQQDFSPGRGHKGSWSLGSPPSYACQRSSTAAMKLLAVLVLAVFSGEARPSEKPPRRCVCVCVRPTSTLMSPSRRPGQPPVAGSQEQPGAGQRRLLGLRGQGHADGGGVSEADQAVRAGPGREVRRLELVPAEVHVPLTLPFSPPVQRSPRAPTRSTSTWRLCARRRPL